MVSIPVEVSVVRSVYYLIKLFLNSSHFCFSWCPNVGIYPSTISLHWFFHVWYIAVEMHSHLFLSFLSTFAWVTHSNMCPMRWRFTCTSLLRSQWRMHIRCIGQHKITSYCRTFYFFLLNILNIVWTSKTYKPSPQTPMAVAAPANSIMR